MNWWILYYFIATKLEKRYENKEEIAIFRFRFQEIEMFSGFIRRLNLWFFYCFLIISNIDEIGLPIQACDITKPKT